MLHGIEMEIIDEDPDAFLTVAVAQAWERGRIILSITRFDDGYILLTRAPEPPPEETISGLPES